jgi:acyl-CoA synthetase (AMP-forming)/AMP-acid ligase II
LASSGIPLIPYNTVTIKKSQLQVHKVDIVTEEVSNSYKLVSCGVMHHDIRIINPDTLEACSLDTIGEIWINSKSVAQGYWHDSEETQEYFSATIKKSDEKKKYLRTGDLGFIHENELYITGRIKDLIILYGKNHYPQDIEASLKYCSMHDLLGNSAAFVVSQDHEYLLTVVCELKSQQFEHKELNDLCNQLFQLIYNEHTLEAAKIILTRRNSIPLTTSGKVKRKLCRELWINNQLPVLYQWNLNETP